MKFQRVIHILEDGRKKYSTHRGVIEKWTIYETKNLRRNMKLSTPAFTADFSRYDYDYRKLRQRHPQAKVIKVIGFFHEAHDLPLDPNIIY